MYNSVVSVYSQSYTLLSHSRYFFPKRKPIPISSYPLAVAPRFPLPNLIVPHFKVKFSQGRGSVRKQIINFSPYPVNRFGERCCRCGSGRKMKCGLPYVKIKMSKDGGEVPSGIIIAPFKDTQVRNAFYPQRAKGCFGTLSAL